MTMIEVRNVDGTTKLFGPFDSYAEAHELAKRFTAERKFSTSQVATPKRVYSATQFRQRALGVQH